MAFRQPAQAPQRQHNPPITQNTTTTPQIEQSQLSEQEWILFSPQSVASTTYDTQTTSTERTRQTYGHSRNSAFGSLDTAARSYEYDEEGSEQTEEGRNLEDEEDGELDSLDSHLHEFRAEPSIYHYEDDNLLRDSSNAVLPTHDGLGSFRVDPTMMQDGVQQHLYSFEQYNPRRAKRRRESLELDQMELEHDRVTELERTRRIEAWRLEQSRALLEEIQRESRRRRQSILSEPRSLLHDTDEADAASMSAAPTQQNINKEEGLWSRITRRVIQDLMGIDDNLLSILFGESLPDEVELSSTPTTLAHTKTMQQSSWEYRLLDRVAKELGLLINQLSDHPDTFSDYRAIQNQPLPYAGLPIISEKSSTESRLGCSHPIRNPPDLNSDTPHFHPTLPSAITIPGATSTHENTQDMDATPRATFPIHAALPSSRASTSLDLTKEEWERQLDIKMVFRYLRSRFISRDASPEPPLTRNASFPLLSSTYASHPHQNEVRAARVRQHHPLIGGHVEKVTRVGTQHRRNSSSCASFKRESIRSNGSSSRHYWDLGGSLGSGSLVASGGNLGAWGEV